MTGNVRGWVEELQEKLRIAREIACLRLTGARFFRREVYDRKCVPREFRPGHLVWQRLLGLDHKLQEAWAGSKEIGQ